MVLDQEQGLGRCSFRPPPGPRCGQTLLTDIAANLVRTSGHGAPDHALQFLRDKLHVQTTHPTDRQSAHMLLAFVASLR